MIDMIDVLAHTTMPAIVFDSSPASDGADVFDLRARDLPTSDVALRNEARLRWRKQAKLIVRVDEDPSPQVTALLVELSRREVRLGARDVERFGEGHAVIVRTEAREPPASLVRFFPIRVRAAPVAPVAPVKGGAHARRR